jgi:antitoxin PrlF
MVLSRSKVTSQGQISIPLEVRKKLGIAPGSILEWEEEGDKVVVRRAGTFSSQDIHRALFAGRAPRRRTLDELKEGIRRRVRERYALR